MAEQIRLKKKYRVGQTNGRYKSGHNDSGPSRQKKPGKPQPSTAYMVMLPSGKLRMVKE
jgi:hypothetical protein